MAYPDVFFSILSIPLFYLFLRIYFDKKLSLGITGIYAISAYFISYSRFAWNTNLIPFFVLLFLLSLYKFLEKNEKTHWAWVLSLGFALGVGFQLHAIIMVLFSTVTFLVFLFSMKKNCLVWKKWAVVLLIFLALNASQIVNEVKTNFSNTKTLINFVFPKNSAQASAGNNIINLSRLKNDIDCHIEANFFLLSSYGGNEQCHHDFVSVPSGGWINYYFKNIENGIKFFVLLISLLFSIIGYFFLVYYSKKEKDIAKKYFLQLIILYFAIGFIIMLPISKSNINDIRYFTFGFFMPFMFLGFLIKFMFQKITHLKYVVPVAVILFCLLMTSNVEAVFIDAKHFFANDVTCSSLYKTTLGELEPIVQYMVSHSNGQKQIYLEKNDSYRSMPDSLAYLLKQKNIDLMEVENENYSVSGDSPIFYASCKTPELLPESILLKMDDTNLNQNIGHIYVYQINK
jgi:4-amino-4-deoxy-L-arabinose transferase-like glycosyltransferase